MRTICDSCSVRLLYEYDFHPCAHSSSLMVLPGQIREHHRKIESLVNLHSLYRWSRDRDLSPRLFNRYLGYPGRPRGPMSPPSGEDPTHQPHHGAREGPFCSYFSLIPEVLALPCASYHESQNG